jgi:ferric-dicitrate binding protein FerR (iron transport regulator)
MSQILKQACEWQARLLSPQWTSKEIEEFEHWCKAAPEHRRAFADVSFLSSSLAGLAATNPLLNEMAKIAVRQEATAERTKSPESQYHFLTNALFVYRS